MAKLPIEVTTYRKEDGTVKTVVLTVEDEKHPDHPWQVFVTQNHLGEWTATANWSSVMALGFTLEHASKQGIEMLMDETGIA